MSRAVSTQDPAGQDQPDGIAPSVGLPLPRLFSLSEVAEALDVSVSHLRREIRLRRLEVHRIGKAIRISREAVEAYLARRRRAAQ